MPVAAVIAAVIGFSTTALAQSATGCTATATASPHYPSHNTSVNITGNITCTTGDPSGAMMTATFHYESSTRSCTSTVQNGTAVCSRDISTATYGRT